MSFIQLDKDKFIQLDKETKQFIQLDKETKRQITISLSFIQLDKETKQFIIYININNKLFSFFIQGE